MNSMGKKLIAAVAQPAFTLDNGSFCKLRPVLFEDGAEALSEEFPNEGEIWWMLNNFTSHLASPGKLIQVELEESPNFSKVDRTSSMYQAKRDTPISLNQDTPIEILDISSMALKHITDLVDREQGIACDHEPGSMVLLKWRDAYFGLFSTDSYNEESGTVTVRSARPDKVVYCVKEQVFSAVCASDKRRVEKEIRKADYGLSCCISYTLLLPTGLEKFFSAEGTFVDMEGIHNALIREAKACLTRRERQSLKKMLDLFRENSAKASDPDTLLKRLSDMDTRSASLDEALDRFADALLEGGVVGEDRLRNAEKRYADQYILEHGAELQSQIEQNINDLQKKKESLSEKLKTETAAHNERLRNESRNQEVELARVKDKFENSIRSEKESIKKERALLTEERRSIQENLQETVKLFSESGDEVTRQFLTFFPLFKEFGILNEGSRSGEGRISAPGEDLQEVPRFTHPLDFRAVTEGGIPVEEVEFFSRFVAYVDAAGFNYREFDLKRFHISLKSGDLTIIGGPSGIGKSSLMQLYARALAGADYKASRPDFLMVNVRPSWMETADLVGHVNSLEQRFFPSENGLFQHLICAASEYEEIADRSALYPVCLDEMNLAQVEYYFSDFLQVMERQQDARVLNCFSEQTVGRTCPFRDWPRIPISPAVRFAGTVNFDETTRRLSDRLLDRANLIALRCDELPNVFSGKESYGWPAAPGRRITLSDMESWNRSSSLPKELAAVIDSLRRPLLDLGAPITPRSYQAICRFVASAEPLMTHAQALDAQLSQRVLSKVRDIVTDSQRHAFEKLESTIRNLEVGDFSESSFALEQIRLIEVLDQTDLGR
ncbi:hypothetical protein P4C99_11115 [Pontiellaceae bacterium B1224]|nr:hypothetical protein [Pontiellaceae bacterium B1224]